MSLSRLVHVTHADDTFTVWLFAGAEFAQAHVYKTLVCM